MTSEKGIWADTVAKVQSSHTCVTVHQGDLASQPHTGNYTFKQVMQTQNTTYEIDLCPSQLKQVMLNIFPGSDLAGSTTSTI